MEKPRVMEIRVRMDCNGCVQKIKKALHGVTGISDLYIDFPQQKVTIIGSVDPAYIVKAIKKTRKSAVVCIHTEQSEAAAQPQTAAESESEDGVQMERAPPLEAVLSQVEGQAEEEEEEDAPTSLPGTPISEPNSSSKSTNETSPSAHHSKPQNLEEIHVVHHYPPDYGSQYACSQYLRLQDTGGQWNANMTGMQIRGQPLQPPHPIHVTHSYNTYNSSPYVTEYAIPNQPRPTNSHYGMPEHYTQDVYYNGNIGSTYSGGPQFRWEPSQPPQPIYDYRIHNSNGRQWNGNLRGEQSQQPALPIHNYNASNCGGQWNTYPGGPQIRGEEPKSLHPIHYYSGNSSSNGGRWNACPSSPQIRVEPCQPTHSYDTYKPSPYATEYAYLQSQGNSHYNTPDNYNQVYYSGNNGNSSGNITSLFSEENPNACSIV